MPPPDCLVQQVDLGLHVLSMCRIACTRTVEAVILLRTQTCHSTDLMVPADTTILEAFGQKFHSRTF